MVPPVTVPGGKPVIAVPGLTPKLPISVVGPVFVTVEPASTAKLAAVPKLGATANIGRAQTLPAVAKSSATSVHKVVIIVSCCFIPVLLFLFVLLAAPGHHPATKRRARLRAYS